MEFKEISDRAITMREMFAKYEMKMNGREWTKQEIMEGFVVDVGDLMRLVMAKEGARSVEGLDEKLGHELSDCLWCVLVLANKYGIDMEKAFVNTMDFLEGKLKEKIG